MLSRFSNTTLVNLSEVYVCKHENELLIIVRYYNLPYYHKISNTKYTFLCLYNKNNVVNLQDYFIYFDFKFTVTITTELGYNYTNININDKQICSNRDNWYTDIIEYAKQQVRLQKLKTLV